MKLPLDKLAFYILLPLGIFVFLFSFINFQYSIKKPFLSKTSSKNVVPINVEQGNDFTASEQELQALKTKDTDKDGLTDYEELYTYKTSPYLEDSDSDKINDKEEIVKGSDPNCPKNKTCKEIVLPKNKEEVSPVPFSDQLAPLSSQLSPDMLGNPLMQKNLNVKEIREVLKQVGIDQNILDKVDDDTLLKIYKESIEDISNMSEDN